MYAYVLCYTCGRSLGDLFALFKTLKMRKYAATPGAREIDPSLLAISDSVQLSVGDILDNLQLHAQCCRVHMMSQVEFTEYY